MKELYPFEWMKFYKLRIIMIYQKGKADNLKDNLVYIFEEFLLYQLELILSQGK